MIAGIGFKRSDNKPRSPAMPPPLTLRRFRL